MVVVVVVVVEVMVMMVVMVMVMFVVVVVVMVICQAPCFFLPGAQEDQELPVQGPSGPGGQHRRTLSL